MGSCTPKEKQTDSYISSQSAKRATRKDASRNPTEEGTAPNSGMAMKDSGKINVIKKPTIEDAKWCEKWNNPAYTG